MKIGDTAWTAKLLVLKKAGYECKSCRSTGLQAGYMLGIVCSNCMGSGRSKLVAGAKVDISASGSAAGKGSVEVKVDN